MPTWGQLYFQEAVSPVILQTILLHDQAIVIITIVLTIVGYAIVVLIKNKFLHRNLLEAQKVEAAWTILPACTLLFLAVPSIRLLYLADEICQPSVTFKAIGHQWYWRYEYSDFQNVEFDSYIIPESDLKEGDFRLLEVDNRAVAPIRLEIRVIVTAADVIHAWTVPCLGVKVDAVPGRLNQVGFTAQQPGVYYGQCSEICGANHTFIPIAVEIVDNKSFINWITTFNQ